MMYSMNVIQRLGFDELFRNLGDYLLTALGWFPYWAPIVFAYALWHSWVHYIQARWRSNIKWTLLEIKVPKEVNKSPLAMEIMLNALNQSGEGTWWDWYTKGRVRDWFSLEIVSLEGNVKFFIRTATGYKNIIEAQLYAQYPDIEIYEVPDYTRYVDYHGEGSAWDVVGRDYKLTKADPYPIKTYIDYGLDKDGIKEEFKIDPITSVIEYLGSIGKGEQIWIQILIRAAKKKVRSGEVQYWNKNGTKGDWKDQAKDIITELKEGEKAKKEDKDAGLKMLMKTKGELDTMAAIERSMGKIGFDCGVRAMYLAKKENFNIGVHSKALGVLWGAFSSSNLNGFGLLNQTAGYDYPWQSYVTFEDYIFFPKFYFSKNARIAGDRKHQFDAYKHRSWFYLPCKQKPFTLTTEELATIFHFPGGVAQTPTFGRIPSRKSEAPVNLPI